MSKKLPNKQGKCLICQKPIKLTQTFISIYDVLFDDFVDIPLDRYITIDCDCMCVYDEDMDLIAFSRDFISKYGKS